MTPANIIEQTAGKFFSVDFIKRSDGGQRHMIARTGVHSHLRGGELSFDPAAHNLVIVYDVVARGYRSIPLDGIQRVACGDLKWGEI